MTARPPAVIVVAALLACWLAAAAAQTDGCSAVLSQGIYNTVRTSSSSTSYSQFHTSACNVDNNYSYDQYVRDSATERQSGMDVNVDVAASYMGFSGSAQVGVKKNALSKDQFSDAQTRIASYQKNQCSSSSGTAASQSDISNMQKWVDPGVIQAWNDCMKLSGGGMKSTIKSGVDSSSFSADFTFQQTQYNAQAMLSGLTMRPARSAACNVFMPGGLSRAVFTSAPLNITMSPNAVYSVHCTAAGTFTQPTDIYIATTLGTYQARIYRAAGTTTVTELKNTLDRQQVSTDQVINQLRSTIAQQQATINDLVTRLTTLENWSKTAMTCTSTVCQAPSGRSIQIGNWVIGPDGNGALAFTQGGQWRASLGNSGELWLPAQAGINLGQFNIRLDNGNNFVGVWHSSSGDYRAAITRDGGLYAGPDGLFTFNGGWRFSGADGNLGISRSTPGGWQRLATITTDRWLEVVLLRSEGGMRMGSTSIYAESTGNLIFRNDNGRGNAFIFNHDRDAIHMWNRNGPGYRAICSANGNHLC